MAIDSREKRASVVGINFIAGPSPTPNASKDQEWRQEVGYGYSGILAAEAVIVTYTDLFFNPDPTARALVVSDIFMNNRLSTQGDTWFDVVDGFDQEIVWDILNANYQDIIWDIHNVLYFIQQFFVRELCFNLKTKVGDVIDEPGDTLANDHYIMVPTKFDFQIMEPINFDFGLKNVMHGQVTSRSGG